MVSLSQLIRFAFTGYAFAESIKSQSRPVPEYVIREVVSGLYYSAFHVARHYALTNDGSLPSTIRHEDLWHWFGNKPGLGRLKQRGSKFREIRNKADYDIDKDFQIDIGQALEYTKAIIGLLDQELLDECMDVLSNPLPTDR